MNAADILSITDPAQLFGDDLRRGFRRLVALWHPDICADPRAGEVLRHLTLMRDRAGNPGAPAVADVVAFTGKEGTRFGLRPILRSASEFGAIITGAHSTTLVWHADFADLALEEAALPEAFCFADVRMQSEMARQLADPTKSRMRELDDGRIMISRPRGPGELLLSEIVRLSGPVPAEHVAWIGSRLFGISAWLEWAGLVHGAIGPDMITVNPETHAARLDFGWGIAVKAGARPAALPGRSLAAIPALGGPKGRAPSNADDRTLIRQTLREISSRTVLPDAMGDWLRLPAAPGAIDDLKAWSCLLGKIWGERKFREWPIDIHDLLQKR